MERKVAIKRVIQGTMLGNSLGLPAEGLSAESIKALGWKGNWRQRLIFGKGMLSDDSEHTFMLAASLLESELDAKKFQKILAVKLKYWLLGLPAGIGFGTLRSLLKLWLFFPAGKSGVYSAGNGPAMRSALLGVVFSGDNDKRLEFTNLSSSITHSDPRALTGALAVSACAALFFRTESKPSITIFVKVLADCSSDTEWLRIVELIADGLRSDLSVEDFAYSLGCKGEVGGFVYHSVPVALYSSMKYWGDFEHGLMAVFDLGGDTDTSGAICGALLSLSACEIPCDEFSNIAEWPRTRGKYIALGEDLESLLCAEELKFKWHFFAPLLLLRNIPFALYVLTLGFLRLLPKKLLAKLIP